MAYSKEGYEAYKQRQRERYQNDPEFRALRQQQSKSRQYSNLTEEQKRNRRAYYYKRNYGVTDEVANYVLDHTHCEICGAEFTDMNATESRRSRHKHTRILDHDHSTGNFRGVLCNNCNRAIGLLGDNSETLLKAAEYVKRGR